MLLASEVVGRAELLSSDHQTDNLEGLELHHWIAILVDLVRRDQDKQGKETPPIQGVSTKFFTPDPGDKLLPYAVLIIEDITNRESFAGAVRAIAGAAIKNYEDPERPKDPEAPALLDGMVYFSRVFPGGLLSGVALARVVEDSAWDNELRSLAARTLVHGSWANSMPPSWWLSLPYHAMPWAWRPAFEFLSSQAKVGELDTDDAAAALKLLWALPDEPAGFDIEAFQPLLVPLLRAVFGQSTVFADQLKHWNNNKPLPEWFAEHS